MSELDQRAEDQVEHATRLPLGGVRVVELANFVSGPFATMMLADLGADVVKVEPLKGDPFRRFGRRGGMDSPLFVNTNHSKRSVALDLTRAQDQGRARALLAEADVLVCNWREGVTARLGLADDDLVAANPELIRAYINGFGTGGPLAGRPTFDGLVQAHLGSATDLDAPPIIVGSYVVDKATAAFVCQSVLAALFARARGAGGTRLDVSLLDAAAYLNFPDVMANRTYVDQAPLDAVNRHAAATRAIRAADGWLVVAPVTARQIRGAFDAVGAPELADEILAMTDATLLTVRTLAALEERIATRTVDEAVALFTAADVPAGACLSIDEHLGDAQVEHNHTYGVAAWGTPVRYARYPARSPDWPNRVEPSAPPSVGQHNDSLLCDVEPR